MKKLLFDISHGLSCFNCALIGQCPPTQPIAVRLLCYQNHFCIIIENNISFDFLYVY